jgi:hypothetical protein
MKMNIAHTAQTAEITTEALPAHYVEYHATYGALSILVAIPVFLTIAYGVFKRKAPIRSAEPSASFR